MFGFTYGYGFKVSTALAQALIDYRMDTFNVTDDGDRTVDNVGSGGSSYDGNAYSSNMIALQSTQSLDVDIAHTLGDEDFDRIFLNTGVFTVTEITGGYNIVSNGLGSSSANIYLFMLNGFLAGDIVNFTFDYEVISGSPSFYSLGDFNPIINQILSGAGSLNAVLDAKIDTGTNTPHYWDATTAWEINVTNISLKQITNPNSFLTYYNGITKDVEVIGNSVDGGSSVELIDYVSYSFSGGDPIVATNIGNNSFNVTGSSVERLYFNCLSSSNRKYILKFNATINSGSCTIKRTLVGSTWKDIPDITISNGENILSLDYDYTRSKYYFDVSGNTFNIDFNNISVKEILPISTTYTFTEGQTIQNVLPTTVQPTAQDIANLKAYPEDFYKLATGKTTQGTYSFDDTDVYSYLPCNDAESGKYVQDLSVDLGSNIISGFDSAQAPIVAGGTYPNKTFTCDGSGSVSWIFYTISDSITDDYVHITFDLVVNSGSITIRSVGGQTSSSWLQTFTSDSNVGIVVKGNVSGTYGIYVNTNSAFDIEINNLSVRTASYAEIANYTTAARLQNQNHGMLNHLLKRDATGRITDVADANLIEHDGDNRYIDTGWYPSRTESWTFTTVLTYNKPPTDKNMFGHMYDSQYTSSTSLFLMLRNLTNTYIQFGAFGAIEAHDGLDSYGDTIHFTIVYDSNTSTVKMYKNAISKDGAKSVTPGSIFPGTVYLGAMMRYSNPVPYLNGLNEIPIGHTKIYKNKALTADEVATAYAKAKLIYPTLP